MKLSKLLNQLKFKKARFWFILWKYDCIISQSTTVLFSSHVHTFQIFGQLSHFCNRPKKHKACQKYPCLPIRAIKAICMAEYVMGLSIYVRRMEKYQIPKIFIFG